MEHTTTDQTTTPKNHIMQNVEKAIALISEAELMAMYRSLQEKIEKSMDDVQVRAACYGQDLIWEELVMRRHADKQHETPN